MARVRVDVEAEIGNWRVWHVEAEKLQRLLHAESSRCYSSKCRDAAMNATTFDSLSAARRLKAAGLEGNQAEAIAEIMFEAIAANRKELPTKTDLDAFEVGIKAEIASAFNRITFTMLAAMVVLFAALKLL